MMKSLYVSDKFKNMIWPDFIKKLSRESSVRSYESEMDALMNYVTKDALNVNEEDADKYYRYISGKRDKGIIKPSTHTTKIMWLRSVYSFLEENREKYSIDVEDYFKKYLGNLEKVKPYASIVPLDDIDKLFFAAKENLMDYCILLLMFRSGLSTTDISSLKPDDIISYENGTYVFLRDRPRIVTEDTAAVLDRYYKERTDCEYLFYSKRLEPLNTMFFTRMIRKYCLNAGIKNYTCREIRNTCGAIMYSYGVDDKPVSNQMGVTLKHIRRYKNMYYKEKNLNRAVKMVKIRVEAPD